MSIITNKPLTGGEVFKKTKEEKELSKKAIAEWKKFVKKTNAEKKQA